MTTFFFSVHQDALLGALQFVGSSVPRSSPVPVFTHVFLSVDGNVMTLRAGDLWTQATTTISMDNASGASFRATVHARRLEGILKLLPAGDDPLKFEVSIEDESVRLFRGGSKFLFKSLAGDSVPKQLCVEAGQEVTLKERELKRLLEKAAYAFSRKPEASKEVLRSVYFEWMPERLRVTSADTGRLACAEVAVEGTPEEPLKWLLRRETVDLLHTVLNESDASVTLQYGGRTMTVHTQRGDLAFGLADGSYPDVRKVLGQPFPNRIQIARAECSDAVIRVNLQDGGPMDAVHVDIGSKEVTFRRENEMTGKAVETLSVAAVRKEGHIAVNGRFLSETLQVLDDEEVSLFYNDEMDTLRVEADQGSIHLIKGLRV